MCLSWPLKAADRNVGHRITILEAAVAAVLSAIFSLKDKTAVKAI